MNIGGAAYKAKVSIYPVLSPKWSYDMGEMRPQNCSTGPQTPAMTVKNLSDMSQVVPKLLKKIGGEWWGRIYSESAEYCTFEGFMYHSVS